MERCFEGALNATDGTEDALTEIFFSISRSFGNIVFSTTPLLAYLLLEDAINELVLVAGYLGRKISSGRFWLGIFAATPEKS